MSIQKNIEDVQDTINAERAASPTGDSETANNLQVKAAAAVHGGSTEWDDYMNEFAKDHNELALLQPDANDLPNSPKNLALAYLIGNGICGPASPGGTELSFTVGGALDN